ncbi:glutathione peroxidase [Simiduia agarivorans]|uniref:Glutathione peroxidase n=1 Tax=Simiduia agarivorans (strain DSM 21679 / JCM 13881 / BCRC 17597 / SA1) TaxID=1117647 RepID=K4KIC9_SIMAS|nr:glutathione peroxidase [Simiduia agarivorans]AFU98909.1 glutathione peroxidase [Simiduia agarivorans SA1 = DSM 21679]
MSDLYEFKASTLSGAEQSLAEYKGKVVLVVNTASKCGFTPQYKGLEALYKKYHDKGLEILGFPCNQFGKQEPGESDEISEFCELNFGVTFPLYEKVDVNGEQAHPLFNWLKAEAPGIFGSEGIKWNFTKFLVGRDGKVIKRFAPKDKPESLEADLVKALG